jgi:hypothetical protein
MLYFVKKIQNEREGNFIMPQFVERRRYRRFEIPGGVVRYKRITAPVLNAGIGGLALLCKEEFHQGEKLIIQLAAPNEDPLNLLSTVMWQDSIALSSDVIVGLEFMEFGDNKDLNPPEALGVLRRLYARYVKR